MRTKWNLESLLDHTGLQVDDIRRFTTFGILLPEGWFMDQLRYDFEAEGFKNCQWDIAEVDRFEKLSRLFNEKIHPFYRNMLSITTAYFTELEKKNELIMNEIGSVKNTLHDIKYDLFKNDQMVDLTQFCEMTGYTRQYCLNHVTYIDPQRTRMQLRIKIYEGLMWFKIKGKWKTSYGDLQRIRRGFNYELHLDERKRKGEFTSKQIKFNDIDF